MDQDQERVPLVEAAKRLGMSENAMRKRVQRGQVQAVKDQDGRWYVLVPRGQPVAAASPAMSQLDMQTELLERLQSEVTFLRLEVERLHGELEVRSEELRRKDHILAALTERIPAIPASHDVPAEDQAADTEARTAGRLGRWVGRFRP